jgi:hypothetical protein
MMSTRNQAGSQGIRVMVWVAGTCCYAAIALAGRNLAAQDETPTAITTHRNTEEILSPPPGELVRRELAPLAAEPPDTSPREGMLPPDASQGLFDQSQVSAARRRTEGWEKKVFTWQASHLRHRPVYFEDTMLERHGHTRRPAVQTVVSGVRFFATFPLLPYAMTVEPPRPATSTLGHFRPGSQAPSLLQRPPIQADAGMVEAGTIVGLIFLVP